MGENVRAARHARGFSHLLVSMPFAGHSGRWSRSEALNPIVKGEPSFTFDSNTQPAAGMRVQAGIDAAVGAHHHVGVNDLART